MSRRAVLSRDTDPELEARQVEAWRRLSSVEIAGLIAGAYRAAREIAFAGLRARHPNDTERQLVARFAALTLGRDLARRAYPDLDRLEP